MSLVQSPNKRVAIASVLCAVAFMAQLDLFIVNVALPSVAQSFAGQGLGSLSWVLNAYAIVFAAALIPAGRLADHFGRRRFLLAGVAVFTLASAVCAAAPDLAVLVAARGVQALGAAMIVPTSLGLLLAAFEPHRHSFVVGIWAGGAAIAASAGPPVGGLLVQLSWRWVFLVNVPIGIATLLAGRRVLPEVRAHPNTKLPDMVGAVSALAGITLLTLAIVEGQSWGWDSARVLAALALATGALTITTYRAFHHPRPLVEPSLFKSRPFTIASIALILFFMSFASFLLGTVLFFENTWHFSTIQTGLALAPGPVMAAVAALNAGWIADHFGRTLPVILGPALFAVMAGYWLLAAHAHPDYVTGFLPALLIGGLASGMTQAPLFAAAGALPTERASTGSAVLSMARQLGSALGVAVLVAVYASADPHGLAAFQRGWVFVGVTGLAAAAVSAGGALVMRIAPARAPATAKAVATR